MIMKDEKELGIASDAPLPILPRDRRFVAWAMLPVSTDSSHPISVGLCAEARRGDRDLVAHQLLIDGEFCIL